MTKDVSVIDYGLGNLRSVCNALSAVGAHPRLVTTEAEITSAERLLLPGVGAFAKGMQGLRERGLVNAIQSYCARSDRPFMGICLGMQMMLESSEEFGNTQGLGVIPGRVVGVPATGRDGLPHKIPHIGWSALQPAANHSWDGSVLSGITAGESAYFVHSFHAVPTNDDDRLAICLYDGQEVTAVIRRGLLYGCQFHPEKSATLGLGILRAFMSL